MTTFNISEYPLLRVGVISNWPFFQILKDQNGSITGGSGIDFHILEYLSESLKFRYEIIEPPFFEWGGPQPNGEVSGLIGMVARREVDLAIDEITITASRETVMDFSYPYYTESSILVSKAPSIIRSPFAVFLPFSLNVWLLTVVTTLFVSSIMVLCHKCDMKRSTEAPGIEIRNIIFNAFRSLTLQPSRPSDFEGTFLNRSLFNLWNIMSYVIYAMYAGILTGYLIVPTYETPINTLEDLLRATRSGTAVTVVQEDSSDHHIFKDAKSGIYKELHEHFHPRYSYVPDIPVGLKHVLEHSGVMFRSSFATSIQATLQGRHKFYLGTGSHYVQHYAIALPEASPWKQLFDKRLLYLVSSGLIEKWEMDILNNLSRRQTDKSSKSQVAKAPSLSILHLQGAFYVYIIGTFVSTLVFSFELLLHK